MRLSVRKVLLHDYPSSLAWMGISSLWLIGVLFPDNRRLIAQSSGFTAFLIISTLLLFVVLVWRLHRASRLFRRGTVATARITMVWAPWRGPFTYDFEFEHEGHPVRARMHLARWRIKATLTHDQRVDVLYDPAHLTRAVIAQFFIHRHKQASHAALEATRPEGNIWRK
jgi:uncharacterized membrane protein